MRIAGLGYKVMIHGFGGSGMCRLAEEIDAQFF